MTISNPFYLKIAEDIKKKIHNKELKPGDKLSSEFELCKEYGTSRTTVRKSLSILANDNYLYSIPGKGSFVYEPEINKYIVHYDEMNNPINKVDKTRLLEVNIIIPDEKLASDLQIAMKKNVIMIRRVFITDGIPVAYDVKYLVYHIGMPIVEKEIESATFPEMISNNVPSFTKKKELTIKAMTPSEEIKKHLNIFDNLALLMVEQKFFNSDDAPIGLGITYFRGDYIKLNGTSL